MMRTTNAAATATFPQLEWRTPPEAWESAIRAFDRDDRVRPSSPNGAVFVGSSTFALWGAGLEESFGRFATRNRGFGGSILADSVHHLDRLVLRHAPKVVVVYAGENDLEQGYTPAEIVDQFKSLERKVRAALPETLVAFVGIKPSPRAESCGLLPLQRDVNATLAAYAKSAPHIAYVDLPSRIMGRDGHPRAELFGNDGWHLSEAGYKLFTELLTPLLTEHLSETRPTPVTDPRWSWTV